MKKAVLALLTAGIFMFSIIPCVNAGYYTTDSVSVDDGYQHVGFTPEKITVRSNIERSASMQNWRITSFTVQLYLWSNNENSWTTADSSTFSNTWGMSGAITHQEFPFNFDTWQKTFLGIPHGDKHLKFTVDLPRTKNLQFDTSGNEVYKAKITMVAKAEVNDDWQTLTVIGSTDAMDVQPTDWDEYKEYWGYGATASEYDGLMTTQSDTQESYSISPYSENFFEDTGNIVLVAAISIAVVVLVVFSMFYIKEQ